MSTAIKDYLKSLPEDRKKAMTSIFNTLADKMPKGFEAVFHNGMIAFVVPYSVYPDGYHCKPKQPLPFIAIASQKNGISFHHLGLYADPELVKWFEQEHAKAKVGKLDMGKGCVRFKNLNEIPLTLIGKLAAKVKAKDWIACYEKNIKKK